MGADDLLQAVAEGLVPPTEKWSARRRYDWTVSLVLAAVTIMYGLHIAWACGYLAFIGLPGFAMTNEVNQQQMTLNNIQQSQLTSVIRDEKRQLCLAQRSNNQSALWSWSLQLEQSKGQYFALTKQWPQVMSCDELLVANPGS